MIFGIKFPRALTFRELLATIAAKVAAHDLLICLNYLLGRPCFARFNPFTCSEASLLAKQCASNVCRYRANGLFPLSIGHASTAIHIFRPLNCTPSMICRFATMKTTRRGIALITAPAMIGPKESLA